MYNRLTFIWYNKTIKDLLLRKVISGSEKILIYFILCQHAFFTNRVAVRVCATQHLRIIVSIFSNFDVDWKLNTHEQNTAVVFKLPLTANLGTDLCSMQNASRGLSHPYLEIFVVVVVFCSVTVILGHNWNLNQAPEKGSIALGASDSVYQTFNRPASYINISQECPNGIHRAIIYFPVISLWHKLDLMKEEGKKQDLFN